MTDKQRKAYEWTRAHSDYRSVAARCAQELADLVDELREQETVTNRNGLDWISVEERLPEKYKFVLCYKDGKTRIGYYIGAEYTKGVAAFADYSHNHSFGVTHWMQLPSTEGLE